MRRFVHQENLKHYKHLLERTNDEAERQRIMNLLAEEQATLQPDEAPEPKTKSAC